MGWALLTLGLVALGVTFLLATVRAIGRARDEASHYSLSILFWLLLAAFGGLMVVMLGRPLVAHGWLGTDAGMLSAGLVAVLPAVVISAGGRNAWILWRAQRRRARALAPGHATVEGRVVERRRRAFGQDIMALVVEADVPYAEPAPDMAYRSKRPATHRQRFVETCPGDHWRRFAPGEEVTLRYDPAEPSTFAVLLFPSASA